MIVFIKNVHGLNNPRLIIIIIIWNLCVKVLNMLYTTNTLLK